MIFMLFIIFVCLIVACMAIDMLIGAALIVWDRVRR